MAQLVTFDTEGFCSLKFRVSTVHGLLDLEELAKQFNKGEIVRMRKHPTLQGSILVEVRIFDPKPVRQEFNDAWFNEPCVSEDVVPFLHRLLFKERIDGVHLLQSSAEDGGTLYAVDVVENSIKLFGKKLD